MELRRLFLIFVLTMFVTGSTYPRITVCSAGVPPVAQFNHTPDKPLINQTIVFDASGSYDPDGNIVSYQWNFGDGSPIETLPTQLVEHTYSARGNYTVTLTVTDNDSLKDTTQAIITVIDYPIASFTHEPTTPLVDEPVTFNASGSEPNGGVIISYNWNFGDNSTPVNTTSPVTIHIYTAVGNYTVTLTVVDSEDLTHASSTSITVINYPVADFTYSPGFPLMSEVVTFNASASEPDGGTISEYFWDFGDDTNGTGIVATHAYNMFGSFSANLTITDTEGLSSSTIKVINVRQYPVASFTYMPVAPLVGETVTFDALGSEPNGGVIISYNWNFGDNSTDSGLIVTHTYFDYGTYNITLTVTDDEGLSDEYTISLRILIAPTAEFTYSPTYPAVNQSMSFNASNSFDPDGFISSYTWDFGDGNVTTVYNPLVSHVYKNSGMYEVTLTIVDDDSLTDNTTQIIMVYTTVHTHDIAVTHVETNCSWAYRGDLVSINVTVANEGNIVEKFNLTLYYNDTIIEVVTDIYLLAGENLILTLTWNTSSVIPGSYIISALASTVEMEEDIEDNTFVDGNVTVVSIDINGDGKIDIKDIAIAAKAYGSDPSQPNWDPRCDFNGDGKVDIRDIATVALHYGEVL